VTLALAVAGWLDLVASLVLVGGLVAGALVAPTSRAGSRALGGAAALLAVALVVELVLTTVRMAPASDLEGVSLTTALLGTQWGRLWIARVVGLAVLALRPRGAAVLGVVWLAARSFQGHAGAHGTVPALVDWAHLAAAAAWLGALVQVAVDGEACPPVARRVRTLATVGVACLLPAGLYGAFLHVEHLHLLVDTPYGRTLLAKLGFVAAILALGAVNHFRNAPAVERGEPDAAAPFLRTVRRELVLAAVIVALSALLGQLPMPHAMPTHAHMH
jgi:putative copper export protein